MADRTGQDMIYGARAARAPPRAGRPAHRPRSRCWRRSQDRLPQASAARLETANGYRLTADSMIMTAKWLLERRPEGG